MFAGCLQVLLTVDVEYVCYAYIYFLSSSHVRYLKKTKKTPKEQIISFVMKAEGQFCKLYVSSVEILTEQMLLLRN